MVEHIWFSQKILAWYDTNKRHLPWRKTTDPYKIWLSEIILQQTRVNQGLPYYLNFTQTFPNVEALAQATEQQVLRHWQGLGYYSRARNLHRCAKIISKEMAGIFPNSYGELLKLPGVGPYTAAAIASFSFQEPVAVVDGNVLRLLARVFGIQEDIQKSHKTYRKLANELLPHDRPGDFNQAIMEFGAMQCTPFNPDCSSCPLSSHCYAYAHNLQKQLPVKTKKVKIKKRFLQYLVIRKGNSMIMQERTARDIWQGLYDFPLIETDALYGDEEILYEINKIVPHPYRVEDLSPEYQHVLSHQKIHARFIRLAVETFDPVKATLAANARITGPSERDKIPKPVLISRYLNDHKF